MSVFWPTWYLAVVPTLLAAALSVAGTRKLNAARSALGGVIRSRTDLDLVRGAINFNMGLALLYIALWVGLIFLLLWLVFKGAISLLAASVDLMVFSVATLPVGLWAKAAESKFKAMTVESTDPAVAETFARWLVAWNKPGLKLKD